MLVPLGGDEAAALLHLGERRLEHRLRLACATRCHRRLDAAPLRLGLGGHRLGAALAQRGVDRVLLRLHAREIVRDRIVLSSSSCTAAMSAASFARASASRAYDCVDLRSSTSWLSRSCARSCASTARSRIDSEASRTAASCCFATCTSAFSVSVRDSSSARSFSLFPYLCESCAVRSTVSWT